MNDVESLPGVELRGYNSCLEKHPLILFHPYLWGHCFLQTVWPMPAGVAKCGERSVAWGGAF